ncbi:MAG: hypothetical protein R3C45_00020, partial [Phycisphaerales bacterium]
GKRGQRRTESVPGGRGVTATVTQSSKPKPKAKPAEEAKAEETTDAPVTEANTESPETPEADQN